MHSLKIVTDDSKQCGVCKITKVLSDFCKHKGHADGLSSECKSCKNVKRKTQEYRDKSLEQQRTWRSRPENKDRTKAWAKKFRESEHGKNWIVEDGLKRKYGIDLEKYNSMFISQNGCCYICGTHQSELKKRLHVDHNHSTGEVRALLCHGCNTGLGNLKEDIKVIEKAVSYLKEFNGGNK